VLDGTAVQPKRFRRSKALTLLKFLVAHRGRPVPRDSLMELLWPEADPLQTAGNLRVVLHELRRALEPDLDRGEASSFVVGQGAMVFLDSSDKVWIDVEEFVLKARRVSALADQARFGEALSECRSAASLYRGDYLEDDPYGDWCLFERERLKEVYIDLMKQMGYLVAQRGDVAGAVDAYRAALVADHGKEEVHRELMRLLWNAGRRDEALRQYEVCRRILREELSLEPAHDTEALHTEILGMASP
jgi:DNA-binding SARP family transcriptional activator